MLSTKLNALPLFLVPLLPLPRTLKKGGGREFFDEYTKSAIEYIKQIEKQLS